MSVLLNIHHVRFAVKDVSRFLQLLRVQLQFSPYASRCNSANLQSQSMVLRHQDVIFIIDQLEEKCDPNKEEFCWGNNIYPVDTVCDVCLQCSNIEETLENALRYDKNCVLTSLNTIQDDSGIVKYAVVKPPVGNVQHTLVDLSEYHGPFLPSFKLISNSKADIDKSKLIAPDLIQTIDHIAYALNIGETNVVMQWYFDCMKFSRLIINVDEDEEEGFVVKEGIKGLRLKAIFAPLNSRNRCDEPSLKNQSEAPKFVFSEALSNDVQSDQVSYFVHMHQGPGVQHIAFGTKDIVATVSHFKEQGLSCVLPPDAYYNEDSKHKEIQKLKYEVDTLRTNNILLESHLTLSESANSSFNEDSLDIEEQIKKMSNTRWFIMQVFTSPVFQEKTLFFEIIQRFQTMSAFGAGNISGLWRAVQNELFGK